MDVPLFRLENLEKHFYRQIVLDKVNLQVERGESLVIVGQSGCGKSVLLKHLIGLLKPDGGSVFFDEVSIGTAAEETLAPIRRRVGMLFQSAALFDSMTVAENVSLGLVEWRRVSRDTARSVALEKLDMVGLVDAADKYPAQLSGGMRKRVGLARAIAMNPEVLLYDEPTTGLDPVTADIINDLIIRLNATLHVTSITVTHDMHSAMRIAERIVMLHRGQVAFSGTPTEFRSSPLGIVQSFISASGVVSR